MSVVIKVENLSKAYQLGNFGTGTLSRDLERYWSKIRGKEDPFLKIGEINDRTIKGESDMVWSLRDINFDIQQGDAVGIIGRNGAGKSTLLKILSRITAPTTGTVKVRGRIASLLEVGTGFHPELTGRENIYLNGAILGMRKKEITRKFDEIVDFAGVERYIDTPVKRYSSGMYVRLAFAVAAHLESEILIVDEVLSVGDAEFQKKCLGKMGDVSKGDGRTVLFVSHNMAAVNQLCKKGIVLNKGSVLYDGDIDEAISSYMGFAHNIVAQSMITDLITRQHDLLQINDILVNEKSANQIQLDGEIVEIVINGVAKIDFRCNIEISISDRHSTKLLFYSPAHIDGKILTIHKGEFSFYQQIKLPTQLANGIFLMSVSLSYPNFESYLFIENILLQNDRAKTNTGRPLNYSDVGFVILNQGNGFESERKL